MIYLIRKKIQFDWDDNKDLSNQRKHKVSFDTASYVFEDSFLLSKLDNRYGYFEERWKTIGLVGSVLLSVIHTIEDYNDEESIRIISARKASAQEARRYCIHRENAGRIGSFEIY